jgi:hypothetical protein
MKEKHGLVLWSALLEAGELKSCPNDVRILAYSSWVPNAVLNVEPSGGGDEAQVSPIADELSCLLLVLT